MNLIPHNERHTVDYTNKPAIVNKVTTRYQSNNKYQRQPKNQHTKNPYKERKRKHWSENIKWKYLPGAICSACGQNNHDIYETGCPAMAVFCNCQKFFNKSKPEHLQPVIEQFAKFKKEQREKQQIRRKDMKRTLKQLNGCCDGAIIRKVFSDQYFEEFPEENTSMTSEEFISNLDDDINSTNSESDSESSSSSNNSSTSEE